MQQRQRKPRHFDRNLVVIGAGSGGLVAAYIAAAIKARVTLIERDRMGGDCLYTGCVPSKALIRSARFLAEAQRTDQLGLRAAKVEFDFAEVMERVQRVIRQIEPHDSAERYRKLGVECIHGEARITSPWSVEVNGQTLTTRSIVLAAGARPAVPDLPGLRETDYLTSDTLWDLRTLPRRLLVIGGGAVGCELAQCFARFGSQVTIVQRRERLLPQEDPEVSQRVQERFVEEGIALRLEHRPLAVLTDGAKRLVCENADGKAELPFDALLLATGRTANTSGYGLEELGIQIRPQGTIEANAFLQTSCPSIYVCGDVTGPLQFTHAAAHQAWYASVNALFGSVWKLKVDYRAVPYAVFTEPEIGRVGLNESQAIATKTSHEITTYDISDLDRGIADNAGPGLVKVLTVPGKDRILGATIVGAHAGELITEFVSAMRHGFGLGGILGTVHSYPTYAEANKYAAGVWRRAHASPTLLRWLERYHRWRRR